MGKRVETLEHVWIALHRQTSSHPPFRREGRSLWTGFPGKGSPNSWIQGSGRMEEDLGRRDGFAKYKAGKYRDARRSMMGSEKGPAGKPCGGPRALGRSRGWISALMAAKIDQKLYTVPSFFPPGLSGCLAGRWRCGRVRGPARVQVQAPCREQASRHARFGNNLKKEKKSRRGRWGARTPTARRTVSKLPGPRCG